MLKLKLSRLPPDKIAPNSANEIFRCIFSNANDRINYSNFTEIRSMESNLHQGSFGSGTGLVPNRRQFITWTNIDSVRWRIYAALGGDEFESM